MKLSIIIVNYYSTSDTLNCLKSLFQKTSGFDFEVILVDTSNDKDQIKKAFPDLKIIDNPDNQGFGQANNLGVKKAKGEFLLLLNNDTIVIDNSIKMMVDAMIADHQIGCLNPILLLDDKKTVQSGYFGNFQNLKSLISRTNGQRKIKPKETTKIPPSIILSPRVSGAALMIRKELFEEIGGFDEKFKLYFEDDDLCFRIAKIGFKNAVLTGAKLIHLGGRSIENNSDRKLLYYQSQKYFFQKHYGNFQAFMMRFFRFFYLKLALVSSFFAHLCHSRESGNPVFMKWIPTSAGMTREGAEMTDRNDRNKHFFQTHKSYNLQKSSWFKRNWPFFVYLTFSLIFLYPTIKDQGVPFKYDWSWPIFDLKYFINIVFGTDNQGLVAIFGKNLFAVLGLFEFIKFPPELLLKIFLILIYSLSGYGFFCLVDSKINNRTIAIASGLFYTFSPYIFIRTITGFLTSLAAYAALPWFFCLYFADRNRKKNIYYYLLTGFLFSLIFSQAQAGILIFLVLAVDLVISSFQKSFLEKLKHFLFTTFSLIFFHLPWIILSLLTPDRAAIPIGSEVTTLNFIASLPHSLRNVLMLSDHHITRDFFYALGREKMFIVGFCGFLAIALFSIFNKRLRSISLPLIISSVLILPLTIGPTGIFTKIFTDLFNFFPLLATFRETYHFQFLLAFALVFLFAVGADWLIGKMPKKINRTLSAVAISAFGLFIIAPFFTFDFAGYLKFQKIPGDYLEFKEYMNDESVCKKIYYPPSLGFIYFKNDRSQDALNADILASNLGIPYVSFDSSVLNTTSDGMYFRNQLTSAFLDSDQQEKLVALMKAGEVDCLAIRADLNNKYHQVSNLSREPETAVRKKWLSPDLLSLATANPYLVLDKKFADKIYLFKISDSGEKISPFKRDEPMAPFNDGEYLPLSDWASNFDYYRDGWSRGRYAFWKRPAFADLNKDFILTDTESVLEKKIEQRGHYRVYSRYFDGDPSAIWELSIDDQKFTINNNSDRQIFIWRDLGEVNIKNGSLKIENLSGLNAIAEIVLVKE